jgi:Nucleotidyl transferase AbiEii toxin, Type IV TA system
MHEECVDPDAAALVPSLAAVAELHELALGGGTACALRLGHRVSRDLDFFALRALDPPALVRDLAELGDHRLRGISAQELSVVADGVPLSATSLGREPLGALDAWNGIQILSALDLAELKVEAAVRRGMTRDLCDLHLLCLSGVDLEAALRAGRIDPLVALKALADPERFEAQPALDLRRPWRPSDATAYFAGEARRLLG